MKLVTILDRDLIIQKAEISSIDGAVDLMSALFEQQKRVKLSSGDISTAIKERCKLGGTVFPTGITIPHARMTGFDDLIIGICIPKTPFEENGTLIRCIVVMLTSVNVSNIYLQTLSVLMKLSQDEPFFDQMCKSTKPDELLKQLQEIRVKRELMVEDIMATEMETISADATLGELADRFYQDGTSYFPVVNGEGKVVGEVTSSDLLEVGIPDYARKMENLRFLKTLEPFEDLLRKENELLVESIMHKPKILLSPSSSVIEAALKMTQHKKRHLAVMEGEQLVGILHIKDFIKKVIRG
ncbi:MAG: CBS domain-containing protein [Spirochaetales bacterium]|nr:CBS domain-containing protein [Spirochaetales bacterium]